MDVANDCRLFVDNDDMLEGDMYVVKSDNWEGGAPWERRPAECTANFNLADRLVIVDVANWWCNDMYTEPFFSLYSDCKVDPEHLLVSIISLRDG